MKKIFDNDLELYQMEIPWEDGVIEFEDFILIKDLNNMFAEKFYKKLENKYSKQVNLYNATETFRQFAIEYNALNKNKELDQILYGKFKRMIEKAKIVTIEDLLRHLNIDYYKNRACCPLCDSDNNTTLKFKDNIYYCFKCGQKGDTIDLACKLNGLTNNGEDFKSIVNMLCNI